MKEMKKEQIKGIGRKLNEGRKHRETFVQGIRETYLEGSKKKYESRRGTTQGILGVCEYGLGG